VKIAALIMAAGASRRFGSCKLLADLSDSPNASAEPLVQRTIRMANALPVEQVVMISGQWHQPLEEARAAGQIGPVELSCNPDWQEGLGASIRYGISRLLTEMPDLDGVLILLADQIAVQPDELTSMITLLEQHPVVCARYQDRCGVPALFRREYFDQLLALEGDKGARHLLNNPSTPVKSLLMPSAAIDIDTPEMLEDWCVAQKH